MMKANLGAEIAALYRCEAQFKLSAAPVIRQLVTENERPLPRPLPRKPRFVEFQWPKSGYVTFDTPDGRRQPWTPWHRSG